MDSFDRANKSIQYTDAYKKLIEEATAAPVAPARPSTKPATPARPAPSPRKNPFKIPAPAVKPRPQNAKPEEPKSLEVDGYVAEGFLREAYEDEADPSHRRFWRDFSDWRGENVIGKHPVIRQHGEELARGAFGKTSEDSRRHGATNPALVHRAFEQILQIERSHKEQLEELAKGICAQIWGEEVRPMLEAELGRPPSDNGGEDQDQDQDQDQENDQEGQQEARDAVAASDELVQKRVLANFLTQGSAVHMMFQAHHMILDRLRQIDQRLPELYSKFATGSAHGYWLMNLERIAGDLTNHIVGQARVEVDQPQERPGAERGKQEANEPGFTIKGYGVMFPILVQELCKGIANYLSMAGVEGVGAEELQNLFDIVDNPVDEWYYIQVGHELWRRFLKSRPKDVSLAAVTVALHRLPVDEQNKVIKACITNPDEAKELIEAIVEKPDVDVDAEIAAMDDDESWRDSSEDEEHQWEDSEDDGGLMDPDDEANAEQEEEDDENWWR